MSTHSAHPTCPPEAGSIAATHATPGLGHSALPYASFSTGDGARLGARIGDWVIDLPAALSPHNCITPSLLAALQCPNLDALLASDPSTWSELRSILTTLVTSSGEGPNLLPHLYSLDSVTLHMPFTVGDYVDFYASEHHARNIGEILRPGQPSLAANWKHLPIGYHGRAGTIVPSGTPVARPKGLRPESDGTPSFGPTRKLDIEAELGFVVGAQQPVSEVSVADARRHLFGVAIVNDWSARDIQAYEYVPLGPFLGKSFATSISHWVTPLEALDAARIPTPARDVAVAEYLTEEADAKDGFDITMTVEVDGHVVSRPPVSTLNWSSAHMLAHMTVNGATTRAGDFFASGTVSGTTRDQRGSFMEMSWGGTEPVPLAEGRSMTFLDDGHTVRISATALGIDGIPISLGDVIGQILPASAASTDRWMHIQPVHGWRCGCCTATIDI